LIQRFGGAALQKKFADYLLDHGLNPKSAYGATGMRMCRKLIFPNHDTLNLPLMIPSLEYGVAAWADENPECRDFDYIKLRVPDEWYHMENLDDGSDLKQLIMTKASRSMAPGVSNREDGSYATKDLFRQHPSRPDYWQLIGRADDTLIM
jgi:hypothetical protein